GLRRLACRLLAFSRGNLGLLGRPFGVVHVFTSSPQLAVRESGVGRLKVIEISKRTLSRSFAYFVLFLQGEEVNRPRLDNGRTPTL
ncbi:hypothetical protein, partial [Streptomyces curacoi]|uniref:hypothetical protein n=1 Tax=Streptomyces curacoi TaxID=146536 RepID=UPI001ABFE5F5